MDGTVVVPAATPAVFNIASKSVGDILPSLSLSTASNNSCSSSRWRVLMRWTPMLDRLDDMESGSKEYRLLRFSRPATDEPSRCCCRRYKVSIWLVMRWTIQVQIHAYPSFILYDSYKSAWPLFLLLYLYSHGPNIIMLPNNEFTQRPEMTSSTSSTAAESILDARATRTPSISTSLYPKHSVYCDCKHWGS